VCNAHDRFEDLCAAFIFAWAWAWALRVVNFIDSDFVFCAGLGGEGRFASSDGSALSEIAARIARIARSAGVLKRAPLWRQCTRKQRYSQRT
jgi:hypothetical protein